MAVQSKIMAFLLEDEEDFKDVYGSPESGKKYLSLGSISSRTLRSEDVIPALLSALKEVDSELANEKKAEYDTLPEEYQSEFWDELETLLQDYAPPYTYVGAHPGDGADIGVWVSTDSLDDDLKYQDTDKLRAIRKGEPLIPGSGYVVVIDDAGDYTALLDGRTGRPIWNI